MKHDEGYGLLYGVYLYTCVYMYIYIYIYYISVTKNDVHVSG